MASVTRKRADSHRTEAVAQRIAALDTLCVGCSDCRGLCKELIEAVYLPEVVLKREQASA